MFNKQVSRPNRFCSLMVGMRVPRCFGRDVRTQSHWVVLVQSLLRNLVRKVEHASGGDIASITVSSSARSFAAPLLTTVLDAVGWRGVGGGGFRGRAAPTLALVRKSEW